MVPLDTRDREILEHLHRLGGAETASLCELLNVTRNAIRQRIGRLESSGLVTSEKRSQARGRPKNVYRVTAEGLHGLGEDYRELAVALWEAIAGLDDSDVKQQLVVEIQGRLAARFRRKLVESNSIEDNLDQLADEMKASGFNVETDHTAELPIIRETNCPFPMLADVDESICQIERGVLEEVLGAPVEFKHRCRDGHHCCEFEVQATSADPETSSIPLKTEN